MTALNEYQKLESTGVWRATPDDQRRDVFVSVGKASLAIYDNGGRAVAHWSLSTVARLNPGEDPARYSPGADAPEELELDDDVLIDAVERVRDAIEKRRPRQGRLRFLLLASGLALILALAVVWLPDALTRHASAVVPEATRSEMGGRLLAHIRRVAGRPCETANGRRALDQLYARLFQDRPGRMVVLSGGVSLTSHLPGGFILLNRSLVEDYEDPTVTAGFILAEGLRAAQSDPVRDMLTASGPLTSFRLLTSGEVPDAKLAEYAETLMTRPPAQLPVEAMLNTFRTAMVPATPYAFALDISGESTLPLIEADPAKFGGDVKPVLPDSAWVSLQGICEE